MLTRDAVLLVGQIWLWPLWRHRRQLLARYVEPELIQMRNDLLNLTVAEAERHLDIPPEAYANRAIVEEVTARCRAAGIPPARSAMARMAASLLTFHRDNILQDPGYGLVTTWEELTAEAAAEIDQALAVTVWEQALRDAYIYQQIYIVLFLVLDCRAFRGDPAHQRAPADPGLASGDGGSHRDGHAPPWAPHATLSHSGTAHGARARCQPAPYDAGWRTG